jgi:hypothetical protein
MISSKRSTSIAEDQNTSCDEEMAVGGNLIEGAAGIPK